MTIGIGAVGPCAGAAVFHALEAAERVGKGAIGGFAVFAAVGTDGRLHLAQTQRGGTQTLFTEGETTGVPPPPDVAKARFAAVISSGPDRPEPLAQFLAADPAVGLVTGHRLPNTIGREGIPLNAAVLRRMATGADAATALGGTLEPEPDVDAGMIALGPGRGIAALNSALVARRPDLGAARARANGGAAVEILHNAIIPRQSLAPLLAEIALQVMAPEHVRAGEVVVRSGTPVSHAGANRVLVDGSLVATAIESTDARIVTGLHNCAAIYLGAQVVRAGTVLGTTLVEPNTVVEGGRVLTLSGQSTFRIPFAAAAR